MILFDFDEPRYACYQHHISWQQALGEGEQQPVMRTVSTVSAGRNSLAQHHHIRWRKPGRRRLKCNVDAAISSSLNVIGFGMCIRDEAKQFVAATTLRLVLFVNRV